MASPAKATAAPSPFQINAAQRALVLAQSMPMKQLIESKTIDPTKQTDVNVTPKNVGVITKFVVEVIATLNCTDAADDATLSDFGLANLLSGVSFTDLNNNVRIQTTGWHLANIYTAKHRAPLGYVKELANSENGAGGFGDQFDCVVAPATIAKATSADVRMIFEVPLAYSDQDLRGAVFANVVNAVMSLGLSFNKTPFADKDVDSTLAVYKGAAGTCSSITYNVYQYYLDQIPTDNNGRPILPQVDLATIYELKNTSFQAIAAGQDFPIPYASFRDFASVFAVYNSDPSKDAGRFGGDDVNYWALRAANLTDIVKLTPSIMAYETRKLLGLDFPKGCYYFNSRQKNISTTTYGNMQLILNAKSAAAGALVLVGWEDFGLTNTLKQGGSLAG